MNEDNVVTFRQPGEIDDALTEVLRAGARRLLAQAVNAEVAAFLAEHSALKLDNGRQGVVRHGHAPEWMIRTGIEPVTVAPPRVRDWGAAVDDRIRFTSGDPAAMGAPDQERGRALAGPVPARLVQRRFPGRADRPCWTRRRTRYRRR